MGKQYMKRMCGMLFNLKWGTKSDIYHRMDRTWGHPAQGNDHIRRQTLYGSTQRRNLYSEKQKTEQWLGVWGGIMGSCGDGQWWLHKAGVLYL